MLLQKAFKYRLCPNGVQLRCARCTAGCRRFVMNRALQIQRDNHATGGKYISYETMALRLRSWRSQLPLLKDAPFYTLQQALQDLDRAFKNFFGGRTDFPTFKKKGRSESFRFPDPAQFMVDQGNSRIRLPKLGWIGYRNSRPVTGAQRNMTVSCTGGHWYASIQAQQEVDEPVPEAKTTVGIDVGITRFATLSDATYLEPLNSFEHHQTRLAKAQQSMSRKVRFSRNWKKAKARVNRIYAGIANARRDYLHKASATLSKNHALVAIENLQVKNMSKSAAGTADQRGKKLRAKAGLNKAILDQGCREFRRQLDYKLSWRGGWLVPVPPHHTSQTCPCRGHVDKANRRSQSKFLCAQCWYENHADEVGAINILDRAMAMFGEA